MKRPLTFCLLLLCAAALHAAPVLTFAAMGDVPYAEPEFPVLTRQLKELPAATEWVVHVGDIKRGFGPCNGAYYQRVADVLRQSPKPLFILPGDNEWNDCPNPEKAWAHWTKHFAKFDTRWQHPIAVRRQKGREENIAFTREGVLVIGLSLVGGAVHDAEMWRQFLNDAARWVEVQLKEQPDAKCLVVLAHAFPSQKKHKVFADRFLAAAKQFPKPILYIHGDGHDWIEDRPFIDVPHVLRVQLTQGGHEDPLVVTVDPAAKEPFQLRRKFLGQK